jgi:hypothetical protein
MAVFQRNWRLAALISACSLLAALGFVLAQEPQAKLKPDTAVEAPVSDKPSVSMSVVEAPQRRPLPQDYGPIPDHHHLFKGSAFDNGQNLAQERAAAFAAEAAREEIASPPNALPLPIQVADEVVMITEQLRGVARNLDRVAADDEDEENYGRADQLRKTAARLRREARALRAAH